jgi:hypothetical protein
LRALELSRRETELEDLSAELDDRQ